MGNPLRGPFGGGGGAGGAGAGVTLGVYPGLPTGMATSSMYSGNTGGTGGSTQVTASFYLAPMALPAALSFTKGELLHFINTGAAGGTGSVSLAAMVGLYTLNGGTALSLHTSYVYNILVSQNSNTAQSAYQYWGTNSTSNSSSSAGNQILTLYSASRVVPFTLASGSLAGNQYWAAVGVSQRSSNALVLDFATHMNLSESQTTVPSLPIGVTGSLPPFPLLGQVSTTSNMSNTGIPVMPASIATANITNTGGSSQWRFPYIAFKGA